MKLRHLFFSILLLSLSAFAQVAYGSENDTSDPVEYSRTQAFQIANSSASDNLTALYTGDLSVEEFKKALLPFADDFYVQGFISLTQSESKKNEIQQCVEIETQYRSLSGDARDELRSQRNSVCGQAVNFQGLASSIPTCVQTGRLLAGAQCCQGGIIGASFELEQSLLGKKTNEACGSHSECRSKICNINDEQTQGSCAPVLTCFTSAPLNGECSEENPNCNAGVCRQVDLGLEGVQCKSVSLDCSENSQCCSGKCSSNKCVDKYICTDCIREGDKPINGKRCCQGLYQPSSGEACTLEFPPFILPSVTTSRSIRFWPTVANILWPTAHAQTNEILSDPEAPKTPVTNDTGLTRAQLDLIETAVKDCLSKEKPARENCLLANYNTRKQYLAQNNASRAQGIKIAETFTPEEYVKRYNIPAINPKNRSDVKSCRFNTAKDNWIDATNLQRNAELFLRAFEVSYSGKGTQDYWHLPDASGKYNKENIYTRTKGVMSSLRDNRNIQKDQLSYMDLMMSCQCLYTFGPDSFDTEQQTFFFQFCTGNQENKICRAGDMQESLKLPDSPESAYQEGKEFPNYVEMYLANLQKGKMQSANVKTDLNNLDSSAAGINHEEVLVRWLRMRSCNQVDVFIDTEKVDTDLSGLVEDLKRAKKPFPPLTQYWERRLSEMSSGKVDKKIIEYYKNDNEKDLFYRGYIDTESKIGSFKKKKPKFLFFIFAAILAVVALGPMIGVSLGLSGLVGTGVQVLAGVLLISTSSNLLSGGGGGSSGTAVMDKLLKDFPSPLIETRLVKKKSCVLGLFWCKTYYRILHWPAYSNGSSFQSAFPFVKKEERTCQQTAAQAAGLPGTSPNACSGMIKGTQCARTFYRPIADTAIKDKTEFAPWGEIMKDKMLMDPVFPEFFSTDGMSFDFRWKESFNDGFNRGCSAMADKNAASNADKSQFLPDLSQYFDGSLVFKRPFQFHQDRINSYKEAVKRYSLCKNLRDCGVQLYDGEHPNPRGFLDIVEDEEQAELFANYVFQIHFMWRHMSSNTGIGYPLAYLENYYLALQYNVRLLTTLSIRRGLEFDDAYNKYAEDLAIRRENYQDTSGNYGVTLGEEEKPTVRLNTFFRDLRSFGFPLLAEFTGVADARSVTAKKTLGSGGSSKGTLSGTANALAAARRVAARIALDNKAAKAFAKATKGKDGASKRLASAAKFFSGVNSPTATIPSFANPNDKTNYSGIGGVLTASLGGSNTGSKAGNEIGAVDTSDRANGSGAALMKGVSPSFGDSSGSGSGASGGIYGAGTGSADEELNDAARLTGMNADQVKSMLDQSEQQRGKFEGADSDSLFEKVSKAYMRNLDRVLIRKKSPIKPEQTPKNESLGDKEKSEINEIFNQ